MADMPTCLLYGIALSKWIVDFGATYHVTTNLKLLKVVKSVVEKENDKVQ